MNKLSLIVCIIINFTFLATVNGLRCYSCNSLNKPYCSDPYDPPDTGELALEYQDDCDKVIDRIVRNETHHGLAPHVDRNGSNYVAVCRKVVQKVEGLECWDCKGNINSGCNNPFAENLFAKKPCLEDEQVCRKVTQKLQGNVYSIRSCGKLDPSLIGSDKALGCKDLRSEDSLNVEECLCNVDGCNGSLNLIPYPFLWIAIQLLAHTLLLA